MVTIWINFGKVAVLRSIRGFEQCGYIYSPESNRTVKFQSGILCGQFYQIVHIFVFMNGQWDRDRPRQLKYCDKYCIKAQQTDWEHSTRITTYSNPKVPRWVTIFFKQTGNLTTLQQNQYFSELRFQERLSLPVWAFLISTLILITI